MEVNNELLLKFLTIIGVSILCGILIGFEREARHKPAGLKTITLVTLGSAIFTFISQYGFSGSSVDPSRIASQIVNGIGFLGAGTIIRSGLKIKGLTTAATLWIAASIGMVIGAGKIIEGIIGTIIVFFSLIILRIIEKILYENINIFYLNVKYQTETSKSQLDTLLNQIQDILKKNNITMLEKKTDSSGFTLKLRGNKAKLQSELKKIITSDSQVIYSIKGIKFNNDNDYND